MSSVSKRALRDNNRGGGERRPGVISRLKAAGLLRADNGMRRHGEAGAFVLVPQARVVPDLGNPVSTTFRPFAAPSSI